MIVCSDLRSPLSGGWRGSHRSGLHRTTLHARRGTERANQLQDPGWPRTVSMKSDTSQSATNEELNGRAPLPLFPRSARTNHLSAALTDFIPTRPATKLEPDTAGHECQESLQARGKPEEIAEATRTVTTAQPRGPDPTAQSRGTRAHPTSHTTAIHQHRQARHRPRLHLLTMCAQQNERGRL